MLFNFVCVCDYESMCVWECVVSCIQLNIRLDIILASKWETLNWRRSCFDKNSSPMLPHTLKHTHALEHIDTMSKRMFSFDFQLNSLSHSIQYTIYKLTIFHGSWFFRLKWKIGGTRAESTDMKCIKIQLGLDYVFVLSWVEGTLHIVSTSMHTICNTHSMLCFNFCFFHQTFYTAWQ